MSKILANRLVRPILLTALLAAAAWAVTRAPLPAVHASVIAQPARQSQVVGSGPYRAGIVVRFSDSQIVSRCVRFEEQEIGGDELLQRSGIEDIVIAPEGTVCRINGLGCTSDNCFCQCPFPNCEYWAYYHRQAGGWSYSQIGAASSIITDGSLDGWSWGQGDFSQGVEPPQVNFDDVCPASSTEATATPTATATTQSDPGTAPPQATFSAAAATLQPGQCTQIVWQTVGATTVTLNGAAVATQGSQNVCPAATQTWSLLASNAAGQTVRQVTVQVQQGTSGSAVPTTATLTPALPPTAVVPTAFPTVISAPRLQAPTAVVIVTQGPQALPAATPVDLQPIIPTADFGGGGVPLAPTAEPSPELAPTPVPATPTPYVFIPPPTETPRPRRELAGPTPTPLLVARVDARGSGGSGQGSGASSNSAAPAAAGSRRLVASRAFTPSLLPQYAAYAGTVGVLLVMGWYVLRRRNAGQGE